MTSNRQVLEVTCWVWPCKTHSIQCCIRATQMLAFCALNPLTPVPPVTASDEPWPFFHFWRHHLWPKLASSILNFCRRKRSFRWCLVHSDRLIETWNMHKNAQKVERKTQSQISCHYTWLLHGKNWPPRWLFLKPFLTPSKPRRRPVTAAKRKTKGKKERKKKFKSRKA